MSHHRFFFLAGQLIPVSAHPTRFQRITTLSFFKDYIKDSRVLYSGVIQGRCIYIHTSYFSWLFFENNSTRSRPSVTSHAFSSTRTKPRYLACAWTTTQRYSTGVSIVPFFIQDFAGHCSQSPFKKQTTQRRRYSGSSYFRLRYCGKNTVSASRRVPM